MLSIRTDIRDEISEFGARNLDTRFASAFLCVTCMEATDLYFFTQLFFVLNNSEKTTYFIKFEPFVQQMETFLRFFDLERVTYNCSYNNLFRFLLLSPCFFSCTHLSEISHTVRLVQFEYAKISSSSSAKTVSNSEAYLLGFRRLLCSLSDT